MSPFGGFVLLLAFAAGLPLAGYWLAALHREATAGERLAVATLTGFSSLLLVVAAVNFFLPLSGLGAWLCLAPLLASLALPHARKQGLADARALGSSRQAWIGAALAAGFLVLLLWPALADRQSLFYDGTANHDSFLWIISGEYLQHHTYMEVPAPSATQPWMNVADANVGWHPGWGRMGAEGLLALTASLSGTTPLPSYLYSTAALYAPWLAAVFLAAHTFYRTSLSRVALVALAAVQPMFVFYYANGNLPNLVGALCGAGVVTATALALRAETGVLRASWCTQLLLHLHGLYVSYPEMVPFVFLPCGLLWLRPWFGARRAAAGPAALWVAAAFVAGSLINPATTIRAVRGFVLSFATARADQSWVNLFEPLNPVEYVPALVTLSVPAAGRLGPALAILVSLALLASCGLIWRRARDRFGLFAALTGSLALLAYTCLTGFTYGWQKTAQFGGVFITATFVLALADALGAEVRTGGWRRWAGGSALVLCAAFFVSAVSANLGEIARWSGEKKLSADWLRLRALSSSALRESPVLVEGGTFRMPFFHGMWAAYFLPDSRLYYAKRDGEQGGYLRHHALLEDALPPSGAAAVLVGPAWAAAFDANSERLLDGREHVLLKASNRVTGLQGVYPLTGVPEHASTQITLTVVPHSPSRLRLELVPRIPRNWPAAAWRVVVRAAGGPATETGVAGAPPWRFDLPLAAAQSHVIELTLVEPAGSPEALPFSVTSLEIGNLP